MTHEVGHNLGCGHANTEGQPSPGPQGFPYSSGYHFVGTDGVKYHTIMGYDSIGGESYELANVFSSPELTHAGVAAGIADTNDNRRVLMQTWAWAAGWRATVVPLSYDVFFEPAAETPITNGFLDVTLTPGLSGLDVRYTLDGSAPTPSSDLYSGPIRIAQTTTVRAAAVFGGVLGPVRSARYFVPDLAEALDTPGLVWVNRSSSYPWTFQTENTWDGSDAIRSASSAGSRLETTVSGPVTMTFRYRAYLRKNAFIGGNVAEALSVYIDNTEVWTATPDAEPTPWTLGSIDVPSGSHAVEFRYRQLGSTVISHGDPDNYGVWLDNVSFAAISRPPVLSPSTTDAEATTTSFADGSLTVSLSSPGSAETMVFYTTDGSDPVETAFSTTDRSRSPARRVSARSPSSPVSSRASKPPASISTATAPSSPANGPPTPTASSPTLPRTPPPA